MSGRYDEWLAAQAAERARAGLARTVAASDSGEPLLDLAGNDYLGLARDPRVVEGAVRAARDFGAGARASRLVTGTLSIHAELEQALAEFTGADTGLVFSTGYHANLSAVSALADADTLIVSDAHLHASLIDACRLARARVQVVAHNDIDAVRTALSTRSEPRALVLVESIYSVLGDAAPVPELVAACAEYDALLVVDEAHGVGVAGPDGRGLLYGVDREHIVVTTTLSKSLGAQGGAVLASAAVRDQLVNRARPFIYDTGLAPPAAGAARAALEVLRAEPALVARVRANAQRLADACAVPVPAGAVLSVPMPSPQAAVAAVAAAAADGVRIGCFRPPSTPDGISRLRLTAHAQHSAEELALAAKVLRAVR